MAEFRQEAGRRGTRPRSAIAASVIVAIWLAAVAATAFWAYRYFR